jgi:glycosyltransferase involved in cell wall biosynthesis
MKTDKKISVIIPIFNAEKYLKQTLDSVCFQSYKALEIVCVLDCPTDESAKIVEDAAKKDGRIKPIYNPLNIGQSATRNIGVKNATGVFMHFMDSDDLINPDFYGTMINAAVNADADVAACSTFYEKKPKQSVRFHENEILLGQDKINKTLVSVFGWPWRYLIKRTFWQDRNLSFPDLIIMEDKPVMISMIYYANKVVLCPNAVYFYKNRENSVLNQNIDHIRKNRRREDCQKARKISTDFMVAHKIKNLYNSISYRIPYKLAGMTVCVNESVEYGKIHKKISVIIPIYNADEYLKQTLDSVRFQTYKNLEIICVLDCPADNSVKIVEETAKEDGRIKPIYNQLNMGLPTARNIGVENATGEYIHFLDSDDLLSPDFYETMISAVVKTDADVAACSIFYEKKPAHSIWFRKNETLSDTADKIKKTFVTIHGWSVRYLIRKSLWDSHNLLFPDLVPMEDKPVMIQMIYYANKVVLCPSAVYFYKYRKSSILNNNYDTARKKLHSENRQKARMISRDFMRINGIKRPNRLLYYLKKRFI